MQQRVQEPKGQTEEQELYESISSQRSTQYNKDINQNQRNASLIKQQCISRQIVFPQKPKQFPTLFEIYQRNAQKIHKLRAQVNQLQTNILEELRIKNSQEDIELSVQGIEQIDIGAYKIGEFEQKRKERQNKLQRLSGLYDSLRKVNKLQGFLLKQENHRKLIDMIRNKWQIQEFKTVSDWLIVLTKCINSKVEVEFDISQERRLEQSKIFVAEQEMEEQHPEQGYTVSIFRLSNVLNWLSPKQVNFQLSEDNNRQKLQHCKEEAEMSRLISKKVYLSTSQALVAATYSHKHELIVAVEDSGRLLVINQQGKEISSTSLDKIDQVISIEIVENDVLVGTRDGVARVYKIKQDGELSLIKIVMCYWKTLAAVQGFKAVGQQQIERIRFCINYTAYQYHLKTNVTTQISHLVEEGLLEGTNQRSNNNAAIQVFLSFDEPQRKMLSQTIKKSAERFKQWKGNSQLIHVFIQQISEGGKRYHFLKGDSEGQLELLTL